jgi:hypothetical protein
MRPAVLSKTASSTGTTAWLPLNITQNPFSCSIGVVLSATGTYGVEYTYDDPFDTVTSPVVFGTLTGLSAGTTTNKDVFLTAPVRAVRLNVTVNTDVVKLTALQGLGL